MRLSTAVHLAALAAHGVEAKRGYGFIGYGIPYKQPACAHACRETLASATLACSQTAVNDTGVVTTVTDAACYATDDVFLRTLAMCISTRCSGIHSSALEKYWEDYVAGADDSDVQPEPKETYREALASIEGTLQIEWTGAGALLNETNLVPYKVWFPDYNTDVVLFVQESQQVKYGLVILLSGFIFPIAFSLLRFIPIPRLWRSKFYAVAINPPLFGTKHDTPVLFNLVQMPTRGQALLIFYLVVLNTVLCAVHYEYADPNTLYPDDRWRWMVTLVANRIGLLSFANLPLVFLYAGRNNVLLWLTDWSHATFLLLHQWIAAIATLQAVLHSLIYVVAYVQAGTHASESRKAYWVWGIVATLGMVVLFPTSLVAVRRRAYELFLAWHVVISILVVTGCYWHTVAAFGHQWGYETWILMCMAIWAFDRVFRVVRLARHGVRTATIEVLDDDYVRVMVPNLASRGHAYVYFPTLTWRVWENHPFAVASSNLRIAYGSTTIPIAASVAADLEKQDHAPKKDVVTLDHCSPDRPTLSGDRTAGKHLQVGSTFYVRTRSGLTSRLQGRTSAHVLVETGYSSVSPLSESINSSPTVIAVVGGVGFTAALPHLLAHTGRTKLYWGCRTEILIDEAQRTFDLSRIEVETFVGVRMNIKEILERDLAEHAGDVCVLVSGPEGMTDEVRDSVSRIAKKSTKASIRLVVESFRW